MLRFRQGCVASFTGIGEKRWRCVLRNEETHKMRSCKLTVCRSDCLWGPSGFRSETCHASRAGRKIYCPDAIPGCHDGVEARGKQAKGQVPADPGIIMSCNAFFFSVFPAQHRVSNPTIEGMESLPVGWSQCGVRRRRVLVRSFTRRQAAFAD